MFFRHLRHPPRAPSDALIEEESRPSARTPYRTSAVLGLHRSHLGRYSGSCYLLTLGARRFFAQCWKSLFLLASLGLLEMDHCFRCSGGMCLRTLELAPRESFQGQLKGLVCQMQGDLVRAIWSDTFNPYS